MNTANKALYYHAVVLALSMSQHWGPWSKCSKTCGGGKRTRDKLCDGMLCGRVEATCNKFDCNGKCHVVLL